MDSHDHLVFHLGSSPKFVRHAFEHALAAAHGSCTGGDAAGDSAGAQPPPDTSGPDRSSVQVISSKPLALAAIA